MITASYVPGDVAMWYSGSSGMSWPPDGLGEIEDGYNPGVNTIVLVVGVPDRYRRGAIVLIADAGVWWCPQAALRGEPSASIVLR